MPMLSFAVIAPPFLSHVRALEAIASVLVTRGHRVTWIQQPDVRALLRDKRLGFHAVGGRSHPLGSLAAVVERAAKPGGPLGLRRVIHDMARATDMLCQDGPAALRAIAADAIIADQMEAAGGLLAEALGLPYVSVACALPVNREPDLPLPVMPWAYPSDARGHKVNTTSARIHDWMMQPHGQAIARNARALGIAPRDALHDCLSPWAQISQTTAGFDFPRQDPPPHFHHVGPLRGPLKDEPAFELRPADDGRPFVFASLGTLQGGRVALFERMARACKALDVQLLIAHCNRLGTRDEARLKKAGATWVTGFAPQRTALGRADVAITHAGLNTALDALEAGTPMLALPIAFDQPGVAARIAHAGAGLKVLPPLASTRAIQKALQRLLEEPAFSQRAAALGAELADAGGTELAADITESVALLRAPVAASSFLEADEADFEPTLPDAESLLHVE